MGNQNPPEIRRLAEDIGIWHTHDPSRMGILKIDGRLAAAQAKNDLLIAVCVSLEARPHALGLGAPVRAASSLEYSRGCLRRDSSRIRENSALPSCR